MYQECTPDLAKESPLGSNTNEQGFLYSKSHLARYFPVQS